jgi:hypothetical protein
MEDTQEKPVDYQLGTHTMDTSGSIVKDEHVVNFEVEMEAVFRRLADDIYKSPEAGIREPLTNAMTTVRRVFGDKNEDGMIEITVQDGEQVMLRLRDTGEGISKAVLNEVLTVIGRSNAIDDGELSGQYGMGFLASYKLVGMNGGFLMCTNPRGTEEGPYSGLFKPGTFEPDKNNSLPKILDEDEYGTVFEYYVRDDISISDIRDWVDKHSRWSPVPVRYVELDEDGQEEYNEDYHSPSLNNRYDKPSISLENEYFEAATSPDAHNDIVLISSPVEMYGTRNLRRGLPWQVDLRLKYENGVVFKGPNKGKIPVKRPQYESMEEERKRDYIPEDDLDDEDMCLPESTGTRERLRKNRSFLKHVNSQLKDMYFEEVSNTLDYFNPDTMSLQDLNSMQRHIIIKVFTEFDDEDKDYTESDIKSKLSSSYNYDNPSEDIVKFINAMTQNAKLVSERKMRNNRYPTKPVHQLVEDEERVFMCVSKNSWKVEAIQEADEPTHIIQVSRASEYETFGEHLNWEKVKSIKKSEATNQLELTDEELEEIKSSNSSNSDSVDNRKITIHYESGGRSTVKRTVENAKEHFQNPSTNGRLGSALVLFGRTGEKNVSDNYWLADQNCSVASCSNKIKDELKDGVDRIMTFDEYKDWILDTTVITSTGSMSVRSTLQNDSPTSYYVVDSNYRLLSDEDMLDSISNGLKSKKFKGELLVKVEPEMWKHIMNIEDYLPEGNYQTIMRDYGTINRYLGNSRKINEVDAYLRDRFDVSVQNSPEHRAILSSYDMVCEDMLTEVKILETAYKANNGLASQTEDDTEVRLPEHRTKDGFMTIKEIYEEYEGGEVIIHILDSSEIEDFDDTSFMKRASSVLPSAGMPKYGKRGNVSDSTYVPILESEYKTVKDEISDETVILGTWHHSRDESYNISRRYVYAYTQLSNWDDEFVKNLVSSLSFKEAKPLVDTVKSLHDNGMSPSDLEYKIS